ncbi:MAG: MFS transporter [Hyphomicrobiales bacterium]|nr:MFS transporter [Hyphomicrobiales bacterium]
MHLKIKTKTLLPIYLSTFFIMLSNSMMALALPWMVLQTTDSVLTTGTVGSIALSAVFLGSAFSRILIARIGANALIAFAFAFNLVGIGGVIYCFSQEMLFLPLLVVFVVTYCLLDAAANTAMESRFPEIARYSKASLSEINAVKEGLFNGSLILGSASAGLLLATIDPLFVFGIAGLMTVFALISFLPLTGLYKRGSAQQDTLSVLSSTRWLWSQPHLRSFLILLMMFMVSVASLDDVLLPAFIHQTTGNPADIGFILASYSVTGIMSALFYAKYHETLPEIWIVRAGVVGIAIFFLGLVLFTSPVFLIINTCVTGLLSGPFWPTISARFMKDTPKSMRLGMLTAISTLSIGIAPVVVIIHAWVIKVSSIKILCLGTVILILTTLFLKTEKTNYDA